MVRRKKARKQQSRKRVIRIPRITIGEAEGLSFLGGLAKKGAKRAGRRAGRIISESESARRTREFIHKRRRPRTIYG